MAADQEQKKYPRGQIGIGKGDLLQATDFEFDRQNGAKIAATLKRNPSGIILGVKSVSMTCNTIIDEDGPERDWMALVDSGDFINARVKIPGLTKQWTGVISGAKISGSVEDGVKIALTGVGNFSK